MGGGGGGGGEAEGKEWEENGIKHKYNKVTNSMFQNLVLVCCDKIFRINIFTNDCIQVTMSLLTKQHKKTERQSLIICSRLASLIPRPFP